MKLLKKNRTFIIVGLILFFILTIFINVWIRKEETTEDKKKVNTTSK